MPSQSITHPWARIYGQSGIYMIRCTVNGKVYIGKALDIRHRWAQHHKRLTTGKASPAFVRDWQAYGPAAFEWTVVEQLDQFQWMYDVEARWIRHFRSETPRYGYNRTKLTKPLAGAPDGGR